MQITIPSIKYVCPSCGNPYFSSEYSSWNNFGARYYTDGTCAGLMIHNEISKFTKCPKCKKYFSKKLLQHASKELIKRFLTGETIWLLLGTHDHNFGYYDSPVDSFEVFNNGLFFPESVSDEIRAETLLQLRIEMWHKGNFDSKRDEDFYIANCIAIIKNLSTTNDSNLLILAELYRNIGCFDKCLDTLSLVTDTKGHNEFIVAIRKHATEKKRSTVVAIEHS